MMNVTREFLLTLFETASRTRTALALSVVSNLSRTREMIKHAADQIQTKLRDHSARYAVARAYVEQLHRNGQLSEAQVCTFAEQRKFDETAAAMSLLMDLPIGAVERALVHETADQILVLAKSIDFCWKTTRAILMLDGGVNAEEYLDRYNKLRRETARSAMQFIDCANAPPKRRRSRLYAFAVVR